MTVQQKLKFSEDNILLNHIPITYLTSGQPKLILCALTMYCQKTNTAALER